MSVRILHGDCRDVLKTLPDQSVQCCVTSPPYFGLRDYGVAGQIGLEPTPAAFVAEMVAVFREVWRVLRDDGTCWLNLGDSYASSPPGNKTVGVSARSGLNGVNGASGKYRETLAAGHQTKRDTTKMVGFKPKDLIGIPWRVAFALQDDGWYLRRDIIWSKPNPMPESVTDRPTSAHEYLFLLTKRARYFYDAEAVAEPSEYPGDNRALRTDTRKAQDAMCSDNGSRARTGNPTGPTRNLRSVWTIATAPFSEAHFATFPPALAETCILAGTSERGACPGCGAPWARTITKGEPDEAHRAACGADASGGYGGQSTKNHDAAGVQNASDVKRRILEGMRAKTYDWQPTCGCQPAAPVPCVVLDPFGGAGTTGLVADRLQRDAVLIELNPEYIEIQRRRVTKDAGLFADLTA